MDQMDRRVAVVIGEDCWTKPAEPLATREELHTVGTASMAHTGSIAGFTASRFMGMVAAERHVRGRQQGESPRPRSSSLSRPIAGGS